MTSTNVVPLTNPLPWQQHAQLINAAWAKTVEAVIETGHLLIAAKDDLEHGSFEAMVKTKLAFDPSTARRLMAIASHPVLSNRAHGHVLPPSWRTLYELTKLPDNAIKSALKARTINPRMQRHEAINLVRGVPKAKTKRKHSRELLLIPDMPTEEEAEQEYQKTLYELTCRHWRDMSDETREKTFAYIRKKYNDQKPVVETPVYTVRDMLGEPCTDCSSPEDYWQRSLSMHASDAVALEAYWTQQFGNWNEFKIPADLVTLVKQAAAAWKQIKTKLLLSDKSYSKPSE